MILFIVAETQNGASNVIEDLANAVRRTKAMKPIHVIALVCVLLLCGTALYIYNNSQVQKTQSWQPPDTHEIVKSDPLGIESKNERKLTEAQVGLKKSDPLGIEIPPPAQTLPVTFSLDEASPPKDEPNANGTPAGAWASTLMPVATENNLFRDPVTRNLYRVQNGAIVKETNPYAGIPLNVLLQIGQSRLEASRQAVEANRQDEYLFELRRANNIADQQRQLAERNYLFPQHDRMTDYYNQQYLYEIQLLRSDYERNALNARLQPQR